MRVGISLWFPLTVLRFLDIVPSCRAQYQQTQNTVPQNGPCCSFNGEVCTPYSQCHRSKDYCESYCLGQWLIGPTEAPIPAPVARRTQFPTMFPTITQKPMW